MRLPNFVEAANRHTYSHYLKLHVSDRWTYLRITATMCYQQRLYHQQSIQSISQFWIISQQSHCLKEGSWFRHLIRYLSNIKHSTCEFHLSASCWLEPYGRWHNASPWANPEIEPWLHTLCLPKTPSVGGNWLIYVSLKAKSCPA